jgi:glycosyltransferase involved in cell wall biosynthesis
MIPSNSNRPLRLLVVPDKYAPDLCGGGAVYTDMCRGLASRGFDVTVRCPYPFYPEWTDKSGKNGLRVERTVLDGVKVERFGFFIPRNPTSIKQRLWLDLSLFLSLSRSLFARNGFDAVIAFCPHSGGLAFAALYTLLTGRPLWLNVQDIPADGASAGGMSKGGLLKQVLVQIQRLLLNQAEMWSSISPAMIARLEEIRLREQPILFVPNWPHLSIVEQIEGLATKVGRRPLDPVRLLYAGNIGTKQGLLDFCKNLQKSPVPFEFHIHGDGGVAPQVREWIDACGDRRFSFGPILDEPEFARALHAADFFVITEKPGSGASFFPSKMAPGMLSATPILAVSDPHSPLGLEVRNYNVGPWFSWQESSTVPAFLASMQARGEEFALWQSNAVRRSHYYDRERCLDLIESVLNELVHNRALARTRAADMARLWEALVPRTSGSNPAPNTLSS